MVFPFRFSAHPLPLFDQALDYYVIDKPAVIFRSGMIKLPPRAITEKYRYRVLVEFS